MEPHLQAQIAFHLTGSRTDSSLGGIEHPRLLPALVAGYQDLTSLRYDFPIVLLADGSDGACAVPLSAVVDDLLERIATGAGADRLRRHLLRLEGGIRARVAAGVDASLRDAWDAVASTMSATDDSVAESLQRAGAALTVDGPLVDCDGPLPGRLLDHAWGIAQDRRARDFTDTVSRLIVRLSDILRADFQNSSAARTPETLRSTFGSGPMDAFDFDEMSRILSSATPPAQLSGRRRDRIEGLLSALESQRFFATSSSPDVYAFAFDDCTSALAAYRERLPEAVALARAIAIGDLEARGEYDEARHDVLFASFGDNGLEARYRAMLPDYLLRLDAGRLLAQEQEELFEVLSSDLPFKVLVQIDDVIDPTVVGDGHLAFSQRRRTLASTAVGLTGVFVLQSPGSSLPQLLGELQEGLEYAGPALFSVYSGAPEGHSGIAPYVLAAAAMESRVFPAFVYSPGGGGDWASRFSLVGNPQPEQDWPIHPFGYQDADGQALCDQLPFTLVDFVACDLRYAGHFACVPRSEWSDALVPVSDIVNRPFRDRLDEVPSLLMVDPEDVLQRVVVDETLIREARRCQSLWHSLQELGGIHNSHAERLLAREELVWQSRLQQAVEAAEALPGVPVEAAAVDATAEAEVAEVAVERSPDEAYIETTRCSTCNECTLINSRMFAYDGNQQAYIADIAAGTFAQLVEAAESCQVSVIHPGRPRDPNEPGLAELLGRAEAFA
jgi:hypothetical protein